MDEIVGPSILELPVGPEELLVELEMQMPEPDAELELEMKVEDVPEPMLVANDNEPPQERVIVRRFRVRRSERIRTRRFLSAWRAAKKSKH